jgi:hypothetical protein
MDGFFRFHCKHFNAAYGIAGLLMIKEVYKFIE